MSIDKTSDQQPNLLDGTVIVCQPIPRAGVYVTVAGRDSKPTIIAFDMTDLAAIVQAAETARTAPRNADPDDLARVTAAGMVLLPEVLGLDRDGAR